MQADECTKKQKLKCLEFWTCVTTVYSYYSTLPENLGKYSLYRDGVLELLEFVVLQ